MTEKHSDLKAAPPAPTVAVPDDFRGDTATLLRNIIALLELDAEGALVPHGVGGHARGLLSAAAARLAAAPAQAVAVPEGVSVDAWRKGARFALEAVSKVDSICWLTDSMKEICIKQAAEAVIAERDRMAAAPAQEHATQLAGQGQEPAAWLASYQDREGNEASYVTTHYQLALENDARGQPVALYRGASAAAHKDEQAARALPAGMEPVGYAHAGNLANIGDGYAYLYPEQAAGASVPVYTAAQVLAMGRVLPEPTSKQIVLMAGAILHQAHGTADTRHPAWAQAVEQAERAYRALVSA